MTRTLICTVGETPQVVTETVQALALSGWVPDRIVLATTTRGESVFNEGRPPRTLPDGRIIPGLPPLTGPMGRLAALFAVLASPPIKPEIAVPRTSAGALINDIGTGEEADAFAQLMFDLVFDATRGPEDELCVSLAGGRKTMSANAAQALQFFGRATDRLYHVVVRPAAIENDPGFWWKGEGGYLAAEGSAAPAHFSDAEILLHPMEVVRTLAFRGTRAIYEECNRSFRDAVRRANTTLSTDRMVIDLANRTISLGRAESLRYTPQVIAVLALIAYAACCGKSLQLVGLAKVKRRPALDNDEAAAVAAWSWFYNAMNLNLIWEVPELDGRPLEAFDKKVAADIAQFDFDQFGPPLSRLRSYLDLIDAYLAAKVLPPKSLQTGFAPDAISFILPTGLHDHPFAAGLAGAK